MSVIGYSCRANRKRTGPVGIQYISKHYRCSLFPLAIYIGNTAIIRLIRATENGKTRKIRRLEINCIRRIIQYVGYLKLVFGTDPFCIGLGGKRHFLSPYSYIKEKQNKNPNKTFPDH